MEWLQQFPANPALLVAVGIVWGISGVPLTPFWAYLGFRCGWREGFALGWVAVLVALAVHFAAFRLLGNRLGQSAWFDALMRRFQPVLERFQADASGLIWARLAWAMPFAVVNAWAAQGPLRLWQLMLLSGLALIPNIAGVALSGDVVANWNQPGNSTRHFAMALGLFGLAGLTGWVFRRWRHARVQRP